MPNALRVRLAFFVTAYFYKYIISTSRVGWSPIYINTRIVCEFLKMFSPGFLLLPYVTIELMLISVNVIISIVTTTLCNIVIFCFPVFARPAFLLIPLCADCVMGLVYRPIFLLR